MQWNMYLLQSNKNQGLKKGVKKQLKTVLVALVRSQNLLSLKLTSFRNAQWGRAHVSGLFFLQLMQLELLTSCGGALRMQIYQKSCFY